MVAQDVLPDLPVRLDDLVGPRLGQRVVSVVEGAAEGGSPCRPALRRKGTGCSCFRGSGRPAMTICPYHVVKIREHVKKDLGKTSLFIASPSLRAMMMPETPRRSH